MNIYYVIMNSNSNSIQKIESQILLSQIFESSITHPSNPGANRRSLTMTAAHLVAEALATAARAPVVHWSHLKSFDNIGDQNKSTLTINLSAMTPARTAEQKKLLFCVNLSFRLRSI